MMLREVRKLVIVLDATKGAGTAWGGGESLGLPAGY